MTEVKEAFEKLDSYFECILKDKKTEFYKILKDSQALVAGGFITKFLFDTKNNDYKYQDMDIYVNAKNVIPIRNFIASISETIQAKARASLYCKSFLSRNNIIKLQTFYTDSVIIDLMHVRNKTNPLNVVKILT